MVDLDWWYGVGGKALFFGRLQNYWFFQKEIMIRTFLLYDGYFWFMGWLESYGDIEVANPTDDGFAWKLRFFTKKSTKKSKQAKKDQKRLPITVSFLFNPCILCI